MMRLLYSSSSLATIFSVVGPRPVATAFTTMPRSAARFHRVSGMSTLNNSVILGSRYHGATNPNESFTKLSASVDEEVDPGIVEGTDLRIVKYPHPSLRAENEEVTEEELKDGSISKIAREMFLVMYAAQGVGLAAPQVGINKRLMVYNEDGDPKKWLDEVVMVNPKIIEYSEGKDVAAEGCLSFPDMNGDVQRSKWIKVEALNLKGKKMKKKFKGWEARIFQHEYDHLDGVVYIDRLSEDGRSEVQPTLDKLIDDFGGGGSL